MSGGLWVLTLRDLGTNRLKNKVRAKLLNKTAFNCSFNVSGGIGDWEREFFFLLELGLEKAVLRAFLAKLARSNQPRSIGRSITKMSRKKSNFDPFGSNKRKGYQKVTGKHIID